MHFTANNVDQLTLRVCSPEYIGIRASCNQLQQNEGWNDHIKLKNHYIELLAESGFGTGKTWLGVKHFKLYNCNTIEELSKCIVQDFKEFKNKIGL